MESSEPAAAAPGQPMLGLDVVEAFFATASAHADRVAIRHDGADLTYAELADRVRATVARLGSDPGVVAVRLQRSSSAVVAMLAVLAAGGTYCPVDPGFPPDRQRALLAAAGVRHVLDDEGVESVRESDNDVSWVDQPPAYVLFTSGSTGGPRPVMTSRAAISTVVAELRSLFGVTAADRVLQFASLNWDTCFEEILPTLTSGATLVIDQQANAGSVPVLLRLVAAEGVTVLNVPTAYWHVLVAHIAEEGTPLPECLRLLVIGGEAVSPGRLSQWHAMDTSRILVLNTYGCTETTLITHAADLGDVVGNVPIGRALPHVTEFVTAEGELLIGGPAVALGYCGLAEETEQRFRIDDHGHGPMRFFHTRDRVLRRPDGQLEHRGRLDGELKVRGVRVDPAEVEFEIARHPGVLAVAVSGVTVADHTTMIAYVVPSPRADVDTLGALVLSDLRTRLPQHLVPNRIAVVPALVHTASGKIDRAASHRRHSAAAVAQPVVAMTPEAVAALFARILEVEQVSPDGDFFDAGGDSLLATRVLSVVAREAGVELTFDDFAGASSPTALAKLISAS